MPEPITGIPPHIAALPEEEQGPALVQAIHERRRAAEDFDKELRALCHDQFQRGIRAGILNIRSSLRAGADALPEDSLLLPGIEACIRAIGEMQRAVKDGGAVTG